MLLPVVVAGGVADSPVLLRTLRCNMMLCTAVPGELLRLLSLPSQLPSKGNSQSEMLAAAAAAAAAEAAEAAEAVIVVGSMGLVAGLARDTGRPASKEGQSSRARELVRWRTVIPLPHTGSSRAEE